MGKEERPLVSIVVPVYNAEAFLRRCLDSLCGQRYSNLEILCLNDASTDASREILVEYAMRDTRMRVIDNAVNRGLFATRCNGFSLARGEYFTTCDADDAMPNSAVDALLRAAVRHDADIVHGATYELNDCGQGRRLHVCDPFGAVDGPEYVAAILRNIRGWNVWGKLYRKEVWIRAAARLPVEKRWFLGEDLLLTFSMGLEAGRYAKTSAPVYFYSSRIGSYFNDCDNGRRNILDHLDILAFMFGMAKEHDPSGALAEAVERLSHHIISVIWRETEGLTELHLTAINAVVKNFGEQFLPNTYTPRQIQHSPGLLRKAYSRLRKDGVREVLIGLERACGAARKRGWRTVLGELNLL